MRLDLHGVTLECFYGDIADQPGFAAVVNAANAELLPGGGVAGAIHRAAGPELARACRPLAPIEPGQAVLTDAFGLPNEQVVHCLGPVYGVDEPAAELLASCYREALRLAEGYSLASIAFPAISTGAFRYPLAEAAPIATRTVVEACAGLQHVERIRFVLWDLGSLRAHIEALEAVVGPPASSPPDGR